jgi:acyl carrier protein phosphodiesterase
MNYLAHIYLSGEDEQLKIGNFIADSVKGKKYGFFPERIQKGIILHRAIDTYTDSHPIVRKSVHRLFDPYSHYSAVIVDILYDHFLAANWRDYSEIPLEKYTADFYDLLNKNYETLPLRVQHFLPYMIEANWLLSYASVDGIGKILHQMDYRTKNKSNMKFAVKELNFYYSEFGEEFKLFFKDLEQFTQEKINKL